jgi:DNA-binding MarR family transcriptional regulator
VHAIADLMSRFSVQITQPFDDLIGTDYAKNPEMRAFIALTTPGTHTTRSMAARSGLSRDATSKLVRRLANAGLVARAPAAHDRRAVQVSLTTRGRRRVTQLRVALEHVVLNARDLAADLATLAAGLEPNDAPRMEPPGDALELLDLVAIAGSQIAEAATRRNETEPVLGRQLLALLHLEQPGEHRPAELAARLRITTGGATYVIDQLEARGLVSRHHNTPHGDRRGVTVTVTDAGHLAAAPTHAAIADMGATIASLFDAVARYAPPERSPARPHVTPLLEVR